MKRLYDAFDHSAHLHRDPIGLVHSFVSKDDIEVAGLIAALLAFGNVTAIRASVTRVFDALDGQPSRSIERFAGDVVAKRLQNFVHRVYRGKDVATLLTNAERLRSRHGSLGLAFVRNYDACAGDLRNALCRWTKDLRGPNPSRGLAHLVPDPAKGSACKRLLLYLRWMTRGPDKIDFGIWPLSPAILIIPVDVHIHRIARELGLTSRNDASWKTAEEVTAALRAFDPDDPVKFDFALCHYGISKTWDEQKRSAKIRV